MCILCPNTRGAFWRLKDPELGFLWVHAACARHLTGASKSGSLDFELGKVPANSWKAVSWNKYTTSLYHPNLFFLSALFPV